ncbi:FAD binding domain-containing protein [Chelatococcus sp. SYSU_G07232]|uniref:FAD binding domain-containing protein n=1 Tax=Chelatococcus albus TaxID=3047466 RepID=A0ABT7AHX0_9HYPH|nr:FAD binding domain-containing protein [Chelatococcus sp. SYSU_G07232]MDJ1158953.1 FAD binding domain-containing protein [Chelatococcus sp. SYSU_G07232]
MYLRPVTLDEAVDVLATHGGRILAGGTDFFPALGDRQPAGPIIDISRLDELKAISVGPEAVRIGARATWSAVAAAPLPRAFDALKVAAREVGSLQIQNAGTVAGNLCNASPAADGVPPLLALDAEVELSARGGTRRLPLAAFITGYRQTAIRPDEIVTAVVVPRTIEGASAFLKLGARRYLVISIAMAAAVVEADAAGRVAEARVAVGACSAVAQRLAALEAALVGAPARPGLGDRVTTDHLAALSPIDDLRATAAYRRDAALTLIRRALEACVAEN